MEELKIKAEVCELPLLTAFLEHLGVGAFYPVTVSAEEIFVNIASYAYESGGEVLVRAGEKDGVLHMAFIDTGKPFNPLAFALPDVENSPKNKAPGGMGIFFIRSLMDRVEYERLDGKNILRVSKTLSEGE